MTMGLFIALGLVSAILLAVYWGRKAGIDAARASDLESIRGKNAEGEANDTGGEKERRRRGCQE